MYSVAETSVSGTTDAGETVDSVTAVDGGKSVDCHAVTVVSGSGSESTDRHHASDDKLTGSAADVTSSAQKHQGCVTSVKAPYNKVSPIQRHCFSPTIIDADVFQ